MSQDPMEVATLLFTALNEKRWTDVVDLVSPSTLSDFQSTIHQLAAEDPEPDRPGSWYSALFGFSRPEEALQLSGRALMIAHAAHRDPDTRLPGFEIRARLVRDPLGIVREGPSLAHVVYRAAFYRGTRRYGDAALAVLTLELLPEGWRAQAVDFSADLVFMGPSFNTGIAFLEPLDDE